MSTPELIARLRREAGFGMLPLLSSTGEVAGLHFHRFAQNHIYVVQAWEDSYAAVACVPDAPDLITPFAPVRSTYVHVGTFAQVARKVLSPVPRHAAEPDLDQDRGEFCA
ncbi:hypothetical protein ALI22I_23230 [Saccharothrix sp. ALI-22-I]|uniref:hypothetical protein n=1 Tax=Saccharothrix sp. ALI-22-I TaxID=1933778 RepID=UPI00097C8281|nr:hypothetical protein [Saccharothrix sp. ALI-22-I]ONI87338.1 hypothetical protein ALI22I_23230 [Saccharothrix sp. ALI-22-I]